MYKVVRFGEQVIQAGASDDEVYQVYQRLADAGWPLSQHTIREDEIERYIKIMERVAAKTPLADLRWSLEHVFEITPPQIARLKAIGVGVRVQDHDYIRNQYSSWKAGPPFRTLLASGIKMGAGTDSGVVGALNPWLALYYMVTGKDAGGDVIIPNEQISRTRRAAALHGRQRLVQLRGRTTWDPSRRASSRISSCSIGRTSRSRTKSSKR